jgi:hypothetical protein
MSDSKTDNTGPRVSRGERPQFHEHRDIDHLFAMVTALTAEVAVLRERLDTHERLSAAAGGFSSAQVDHYPVDGHLMQERASLRQSLLDRVFRCLAPPRPADGK